MERRDFSRRSSQAELMDEPSATREDLVRCLVDLAAANRVTGGYRPTLSFLERLRRAKRPTRPLRIVDVGCGSGDMLRAVTRWAHQTGTRLELIGLDINPTTLDVARSSWRSSQPVSWVAADVLTYEPPRKFDVVLSSLFAHHLTNPQLVRFLAWMDGVSRVGWFVNDLHRHPLPYHSFRLLSRLSGWHRFVRHDGPVSIARAFARDDWRELLRAAQIDVSHVRIRWWTPFRLCVERLRTAA